MKRRLKDSEAAPLSERKNNARNPRSKISVSDFSFKNASANDKSLRKKPKHDSDKTEKTEKTEKPQKNDPQKQWVFDKQTAIYIGMAVSLAIIIITSVLLSSKMTFATRDVVLNDNGFKVSIASNEKTVGELLANTGVVLGDYDALDYDLSAEITDDMEIAVYRAVQVNIQSGTEQKQVFMLSGTVKDALNLGGVSVAQDDEVYPSPEEFITSGMTITHILVDKQIETEQSSIGYKEITRNNSTILKGTTKVSVAGAEGLLETQIEITYKNGIETKKEKIASNVVVEPVNKVVEVGTKPKPTPTPTPTKKPTTTAKPTATAGAQATANAQATPKPESPKLAADSETGLLMRSPTTAEIYSDTLYEHKNKPAPHSSIIDRVLVARQITAYASTGKRTATGTIPRIGTIACYFGNLPKYTKIYVPGYGYGRVEDQGGGKDPELDLDVFMESNADCLKWGRKRNKEIYVLK